MFKYCMLLLLSFLFYGDDALASTPTNTLFVVDVSLSANEKDIAFEIIKETIQVVPQTHSIGLTLFDDTVRGYIAPAQLDEQQIEALHQAMANAPVSVRSTSNFSIGIERAIDAFEHADGANLVVFSRGVIDTKSEDPRAQSTKYIEWLEKVLLPQATQNNIVVNLVVNQNHASSGSNLNSVRKQTVDLFTETDEHFIINWASESQIAPELISLLNISDRDYAEVRLSEDAVTPSTAATNTNDTSEVVPEGVPEKITEQTSAIDHRESSNLGILSIARIVLLAVCLVLLVGIVVWRYRARSDSKIADETGHSSSSYLPLTRKPSEAIEEYMEKETDLAIKPDSNGEQ